MEGKREVNGKTPVEIPASDAPDTTKKKRAPRGGGRRVVKQKSWKKRVIALLIALVILAGLYLTAVFSNIAFIAKWRTIYIETAMSTKSHQWLATMFIPASVVNEVMDKVNADLESQIGMSSSWDVEEQESEPASEQEAQETDVEEETAEQEQAEEEEIIPEEEDNSAELAFYETYWELDSESVHAYLEENPDVVADGYDSLLIDNSDGSLELTTVNGDTIYVIDTENNLFIAIVTGDGFEGKLAVVKNAEQLSLVKSSRLGSYGQLLTEITETNNAVLAINCSGFSDEDGHGTGGTVVGSLIIDGVEYGTPETGSWKLFGYKADNRLYITDYSSEAASEFVWAAQFFPALIIDGESVVDGTFGMGLQPRSCVGQAKNGDVLLMVIDGRQIGHSLGCTVADCVEILMNYGAYQAINLDGGSSALMVYKNEVITSSSAATKSGRYLPDALVISYGDGVVIQED